MCFDLGFHACSRVGVGTVIERNQIVKIKIIEIFIIRNQNQTKNVSRLNLTDHIFRFVYNKITKNENSEMSFKLYNFCFYM